MPLSSGINIRGAGQLLVMQTKGQIEIIAVIAFVIIGVVAAFIVMNTGGPGLEVIQDMGLTDEAKLIKDSVSNLIRTGTLENIDVIYDNGGYLDASDVTNIEYGGLNVPVWQACTETMAPDLATELRKGITSYIAENLDENSDFYGKGAEFDIDDIDVRVNVLSERVDVTVNLPTKIDGISIPQPYKVTVPSNIKKITEFAEDFITESSESKIFETATVVTMARSNPESEYWMPVAGAVSDCGKKIIRTRNDLVPALGQMIRYAISHVVWNGVPIEVRGNPFFYINGVGGKPYDDLDVEFSYPPSWDGELAKKFSSTPETIRITARPIMPGVPVCIGTYAVTYSFQYPVIISVKDDIRDKYFRFAVFVSVRDSQPDDRCVADVFSGTTEYEEDCVVDADCDFNISVTDSSGEPIEGADVMFYKCHLGRTDEEGNLVSVGDVKAPCMIAGLEIYKEGYRTYGNFISSYDMSEGIDAKLIKRQEGYDVHFMGVPLKAGGPVDDGDYATYEVTGKEKPVTEFTADGNSDIQLMINFYPLDPNYITGEDIESMIYNMGDEFEFTGSIETDGLYPADFAVGGVAVRNSTQIVVGYINTTFTIKEGDDSVYVYMPIVTEDGGGALSASINESEAGQFEMLSGCIGSGLLSSEESGDAQVGCVF